MSRALFLLLLLPLAGCATPYQSGGLGGGYYQSQGPGPLEKISFTGNGYIQAATVQQYALYRTAEVAKQKNKPYFLIYDTLASASLSRPSELPTIGNVGGKPVAFAFVLFLDAPQSGAKDTAQTLKDVGEVIKKDQPQT